MFDRIEEFQQFSEENEKYIALIYICDILAVSQVSKLFASFLSNFLDFQHAHCIELSVVVYCDLWNLLK